MVGLSNVIDTVIVYMVIQYEISSECKTKKRLYGYIHIIPPGGSVSLSFI